MYFREIGLTGEIERDDRLKLIHSPTDWKCGTGRAPSGWSNGDSGKSRGTMVPGDDILATLPYPNRLDLPGAKAKKIACCRASGGFWGWSH